MPTALYVLSVTDMRIRPLEPYRGSHYQPFRSSTVAPIICCAPGFEALRATLPDLSSPQQSRPCLAGVAYVHPWPGSVCTTYPLLPTEAMFYIPTTYLLP